MNSKTISHCCHPHSSVREFTFFARSNDLALSDLAFVFLSINKEMKDWNVPCEGGGWEGRKGRRVEKVRGGREGERKRGSG